MELSLSNVLIGIGIIVFIVFLFYILREFNCWYWKINERIEIQKHTNYLLEKLLNENPISIKSQVNNITKESLEKSDVNNPEVLQEMIKKYSGNKE